MQQNDFEQVDLSTFFDSQSQSPEQNEKAEMLTTQQKQLIQEVMPLIKQIDPEKAQSFQERLDALESLAQSVSRFPSMSPSRRTNPLMRKFPVIEEPFPIIVFIEMSSTFKAIKTYFDNLTFTYFAGSTTSEPM